MIIQRLEPGEARRAHDLLAASGQALLRQGLDHWSPPAPLASVTEQCTTKEVFVAVLAGRDAATWTMGTFGWHDDPGWSVARSPWYLSRFTVHPDLQGHGIGRALAERIVAAWRARGADVIRLDVVVASAAAVAFWERLGWRRCGGWNWTNWHGKHIDLINLERKL
ncbi:hypothetical protein LBMAG53_26290 [Planctomycetota bacterium]|nr:hypothetical protein LBMAG53_26290 [Planctomycetota bacterium]